MQMKHRSRQIWWISVVFPSWFLLDNVKNRLWKKPHFICSFSKNVFFGYRIAMDATAAWARGQISKPPKMLLKFVMSISYETRSIQIWCGDCYPSFLLVRWIPPPPTGRPRGGTATIKKNTPWCQCHGEALKLGTFVYRTIFMIRVWTESIHVCFSRTWK